MAHYLLRCPSYTLARAVHLAPLGRDKRNLPTLLGDREGLRPLFKYIEARGRFRQTHGSLDRASDKDKAREGARTRTAGRD